MLKRIFKVAIASALLVATVYAHEPGGFNGRLYGAEVMVGGAMTLAPVLIGVGFATGGAIYTKERDEKYALYLTSIYPLLMNAGVFLVGEIWGASSENKAVSYFVPTATSFGIMAVTAYVGSRVSEDPEEGAVIGEWFGIVPNAFLCAYLYNVLKKPKSPETSTTMVVEPYINISRNYNNRDDITLKWGFKASF
jgi:hypothetical protein